MKRFEQLSGIEVRHDGMEVKLTLHASTMKPLELGIPADMLEALTVQFARLSVACAKAQGLPLAIEKGSGSSVWPIQVDNFGVMPSGHPQESLLVIPLGLFSLAFSMPSESLRNGAAELAQIGLAMEQEPRTLQ